jgi:hypothetical protein
VRSSDFAVSVPFLLKFLGVCILSSANTHTHTNTHTHARARFRVKSVSYRLLR